MSHKSQTIIPSKSGSSFDAAQASPVRVPELLSPAGDWECARAAVENGADAIYFGLDRHNARMRANNFTVADLPSLMAFLHRRGVRGYVTLNTLIFTGELSDVTEMLRDIIAAGVDGIIVQDVGICRLIRELSPDMPIHASTQMTITSAAGIEFARELGCNLAVLARECTIKEIEKIREAASEIQVAGDTLRESDAKMNRGDESRVLPHPGPLPLGEGEFNPSRKGLGGLGAHFDLEVFIHGALCVAYSGQCLTSESLGGRSANRGECAQACRMPYELISDGKTVPLGDRRYLLSPQDLAGLDVLPDLIRAGVNSLKIEGRLKTPEYVANITRVYREAIDKVGTSSTSSPSSSINIGDAVERVPTTRHSQYDMEMAFSRGLFTGWFRGINNQALVHARFGKKRGVYLGEVSRVHGDLVYIQLEGPLKLGDGVVFDAGHPDQEEEGGRVYEIRNLRQAAQKPEVALAFGEGDINFARIHRGDKLWKTSDPELDRRLRQSFAGEQIRYQRPIDIEVRGEAGQPMALVGRDESGNVVELNSSIPLAVAQKQPLTSERLEEQLGRMGGTPFKLGKLVNELRGPVIVPMSELNRLRREMVAELETRRINSVRWKLNPDFSLTNILPQRGASPKIPAAESELIALVRTLPQLEAAMKFGIATIYCDFEDPKKYRDAVALFRSGKSEIGNRKSAIFVAPPRIFKAGEEWVLKIIQSAEADGYLVRNYEHLKYFSGSRCIGDYSLNISNPISAQYFLERYKLERVTASYDLNIMQLEELLKAAPPEWFEITIHQHMPMFHMEHCVFCAFLTTGTDYTNCGRPCDTKDLKLRDRVGAEHPVKADAGCRNTVFNARAQTGAESLMRMCELGARRFRVEFLNETPVQATQTLGQYQKLLRGEISGAELWRELKLVNQLGVTRGQLLKAG